MHTYFKGPIVEKFRIFLKSNVGNILNCILGLRNILVFLEHLLILNVYNNKNDIAQMYNCVFNF